MSDPKEFPHDTTPPFEPSESTPAKAEVWVVESGFPEGEPTQWAPLKWTDRKRAELRCHLWVMEHPERSFRVCKYVRLTPFEIARRQRFNVGVVEYGDRSWDKPASVLLGEVAEEGVDFSNWFEIAWPGLQRAIQILREAEK